MKRYLLAAAAAAFVVTSAAADEITDTLQNAIDAYNDGDVQYALEEIAFAQQLLQELKAGALVELLPPAPEGWTRSIDDNQNIGAIFGGGTGAAAVYSKDNTYVNVSIIMDSPMIAGMAGIFGNAALIASQGKMVRVGREKFIDQGNEMVGMIDGRIMIRADGADADTMIPILEGFNFRELSRFGL